jgi:hypothetical protein
MGLRGEAVGLAAQAHCDIVCYLVAFGVLGHGQHRRGCSILKLKCLLSLKGQPLILPELEQLRNAA